MMLPTTVPRIRIAPSATDGPKPRPSPTSCSRSRTGRKSAPRRKHDPHRGRGAQEALPQDARPDRRLWRGKLLPGGVCRVRLHGVAQDHGYARRFGRSRLLRPRRPGDAMTDKPPTLREALEKIAKYSDDGWAQGEARAALAAAEAEDGWRPISEAPKDQSPVWVSDGNVSALCMYVCDGWSPCYIDEMGEACLAHDIVGALAGDINP